MDKECMILSYGESQGVYIDINSIKEVDYRKLDYSHKLVQKMINNGYDVSFYHTNSLQLNKLHHMKDMLIYNLNYETIKKLQIESVEYNQRKVFGLGKLVISDGIKPVIDSVDKKCKLRDSFMNAKNSIVLWSGGANDIMYYINNNPLKAIYAPHTISKALDRMNSEELKTLFRNEVRDNFENIYKINPQACVVALGFYPPKVLQTSRKFRAILSEYNNMIESIVTEYGGIYISEDDLGQYCGLFNFHISEEGHEKLATKIFEEYNKYLDRQPKNRFETIQYQMEYFQHIRKIDMKNSNEQSLKSKIYDELLLMISDNNELLPMIKDICERIEEIVNDHSISKHEKRFKIVQKMDELKSILNVINENKKTYKLSGL